MSKAFENLNKVSEMTASNDSVILVKPDIIKHLLKRSL